MNQVVLVVVGGGLGSGARYLVSTWAFARLGSTFPWGTLTVNVVGSFLLGAIMQLGLSTDLIRAETRLFLATGLMGGFTTYSTFNYETLGYLQDGNWMMAIANAASTFCGCLLAGIVGVAVVRVTVGA